MTGSKEVRRAAKASRHPRPFDGEVCAAAVRSAYDDVARHVSRMKAAAGVTSTLPGLEALWNPTDDTLLHLRRAAEPLGGARAKDYDDAEAGEIQRFHRRLRKLRRKAGDELIVTEPQSLGWFGFTRGSTTYTADTLKYSEVFAALKLGAVIPVLQGTVHRPIVWEFGGDWGGFAYHLKRLFPQVTYIVSGHPDRLLLSATYVRVMFPEARMRFFADDSAQQLWRDGDTADFVFIPEGSVDDVKPAGLDLVVDLMALEKMPAELAERYVRRAFTLGATFCYSAVPSTAAIDVRALLARHYWLHELPIASSTEGALRPWPSLRGGQPLVVREHVIGWKRLLG
jgi:hypothetical protein